MQSLWQSLWQSLIGQTPEGVKRATLAADFRPPGAPAGAVQHQAGAGGAVLHV